MYQFYRLHLITRKRLGIPIQPRSLFQHLYEELIVNDKGFIILIKNKEKVIATALFLIHKNVLTYKYGASDTKYLKYRPNNLLFYVAMNHSRAKGYSLLDLGKTDVNQTGLRRFKNGWAAQEESLYYSYYPKIPRDGLYTFAKDNIISTIIKFSPKLVCKIAGELFYKYVP